MNKEAFIKELNKLNIYPTPKQLEQLSKYFGLLIEWNQKINITAITKEEDVYLKHFYDSLTLIKSIDLTKITTMCDIGSGAGFPGIVIKIFYPNIDITLIDSLNKRVNFLTLVIEELKLENIKAIHSRIETYNKNIKYDLVTARAVAKLNILLELAIPITKINGFFIAMKGNIKEEIEQSKNALKVLKAEIEDINEFLLPYENSTRTLIRIIKKNETPSIYPRDFDKIIKKPL